MAPREVEILHKRGQSQEIELMLENVSALEGLQGFYQDTQDRSGVILPVDAKIPWPEEPQPGDPREKRDRDRMSIEKLCRKISFYAGINRKCMVMTGLASFVAAIGLLFYTVAGAACLRATHRQANTHRQAGPATFDQARDEFETGYITAVLACLCRSHGRQERQLGWEAGTYRLEVRDGKAVVAVGSEDPSLTARASEKLEAIEGLKGVQIETLLPPSTAPGPEPRQDTAQEESLEMPRRKILFPGGNLFERLIADPKQPRFFVSAGRYDTDVETIAAAMVGYGENFGLVRYPGSGRGDGIQFNIDGALFAQFNLDAPSKDLVNADYTLGFPVTWRYGTYSAKLRLYHQSSHLGDEFLLRTQSERVNLSFEAIELLGSHDWRDWRTYLGGEYLLHREPGDLHRAMMHGGVEYYGSTRIWNLGRLLAGLDLKGLQEHDWTVDASLKAGFELGQPKPGRRNMRFMAEGFKGHAPYGQFYNDRVSYVGVSVSLGL